MIISMKKRKLQNSTRLLLMPDSAKDRSSALQIPDEVIASNITTDQSSTSEIPDEVIASNIFIHLPLRQLIQLRTLSKSMNELLQCKSLLQKWRSTSDCWLLMAKVLPSTRPKQVFSPLLAFNIFDKDVHDKSFPMPLNKSLLPSLISSFMESLSKVKKIAPVHLVASAGGLICALILGEVGTSDDYSLLIFNPLTGCQKTLPKPPKENILDFESPYAPSFTLNMVTRPAAGGRRRQPSYYVILQAKRFLLHIYSSVTKKWKLAKFHVAAFSGDIRSADVIFDACTFEEESRSLLIGYNIDRDEWYDEYVWKPWGDDLDDEVSYLRHRGQLYMVGGIAPTSPMTRGRTTRLSQLFRLKPGFGWVNATSLNHRNPHKKCPHHDPYKAPHLYEDSGPRGEYAVSVYVEPSKKGVRPQFHIGPLGTVPTHSFCPCISSEWLKLLSSPPPSYATLSLYVPSFAAKP